jgi:hypothetical protein
MQEKMVNNKNNKPEWSTKRKRNTRLVIIVMVAFFIITKMRIVSWGEQHLLIIGLDSTTCWTLHPKTLQTKYGTVALKVFTPVGFSNGHLSAIRKTINIRPNLTIMNNRITQNVSGISSNYYKPLVIYFPEESPQLFNIGKYNFKIANYREEGGPFPIYLLIKEFPEIRLSDYTRITLDSIRGYCILKMDNNHWELYDNTGFNSFILNNPQWEKEIMCSSVIFEKDWGKMLEYKEVMHD